MNADTPFRSLASCRVALKGLLDRASLINQAVDLLAADGSKLGQAVVTMRMQHSIFASVERYRRSERSKMQPVAVAASSGVLEALGVPLDKIQLAVTILSCEGLRGTRYGALPWPYCQYELPVKWPEQEPTHVTETRTKEANPVYNDRKVGVKGDSELMLSSSCYCLNSLLLLPQQPATNTGRGRCGTCQRLTCRSRF